MNLRIRQRMGERLREIRLARGISQGELANRIDATAAEVSNYERARSFPRVERLVDISEALGVDISMLFTPGKIDRHAFHPEVAKVALLIERHLAVDPRFARRMLKIVRSLIE